jgi:arylformamidase
MPTDIDLIPALGRDELEAMLSDALGAGASRVPERLLLRTGHGIAAGTFPEAWPVLTPAAAEWLVAQGLRLWGVDAPSVDERTSTTLPVHHVLLGRGAFVLENLDLRGVAPGRYELLAPPLAVDGADAAPVRAVLRNVR